MSHGKRNSYTLDSLWSENISASWASLLLIDIPLPPIPDFHFSDPCNKPVPVYLSTGCSRLSGTLLNYIYRPWFKPFRSEIEHGRFISKSIAPTIERGNASQLFVASVENILPLHKAICAGVRERRKECEEAIAPWANGFYISNDEDKKVLNFILQPFFEALVLIIHPEDWNGEDSSSIGRLPVTMARTEVENGLSAPTKLMSTLGKPLFPPLKLKGFILVYLPFWIAWNASARECILWRG